ncbi:MAG: hypothetical protein FJ125_05315, partial [Deltaproteobacteria bacterium]|nr:hypothetical protein [Deltaproteobacteria bacterium]
SEELRLASAAIAAEQWERLIPLGTIAVPLLLQLVGERGQDAVANRWRAGGAWALGELADPLAREALLALLRNEHPRVRAAAARGLGRLADPLLAEALQQAWNGECTPEVRIAILEGAALLGGETTQALCAAGLQDADPEVRVAAARAMGRAVNPQADRLIAALSSPDGSVRQQAAGELGRLGDPVAIDPLCGVLADSQPGVRQAARASLIQLGWHPVGWRSRATDKGYAYWTARSEWLGADVQEAQLALLLRALDQPDPDRRRNAAEALGLIGDPAALAVLQRAAQEDGHPDVRSCAAEAAAQLQAAAQRRAALAEELLAAAAAAAAAAGTKEAGERQAAAAGTKEAGERQAAAAGTKEAGERQAAAVLARGLEATGEPLRRAAAAEALGRLGVASAAPLLARALADPAPQVRVAALDGLARLGGETALEALAAALADPFVAASAARALARMGSDGAARLSAALQHEAASVRRWAATGLGEAGEHAAGVPLLSLLDDPDTAVRAAAAAALGALGAGEAGAPLQRLLAAAPEGPVRAAAARALARLGATDAAEALRRGLADPLAEVRASCLAALEQLGLQLPDELRRASAAIGRSAWEEGAALPDPSVLALLLHVLEEPPAEGFPAARRAGAATALGRRQDAAARPALLRAVAGAEPEVQAAAAAALGELGPSDGVSEALLPLAGSSHLPLRAAVAAALGRLGGAGELPRLLEALSDEAPEVRLAALSGLGWLGRRAPQLCRAVVTALAAQLASAADPALRAHAAALLGRTGDREAIEPLARALAEDAAAAVRQAAEAALEQLGWVPVAQKLRVRSLLAELGAAEARHRAAAAEQLGLVGDDAAVQPLRSRLDDADAAVRLAVCHALVRLGEPPPAAPEFIPYWLDTAGWEALAEIGVPAVAALSGVLEERRKDRKRGAVNALAAIADARALPPLIQALADPEPEVRRAAARGLGRRQEIGTLGALLGLLGDSDCEPDVAIALAELGDPAAAPLQEILGNERPGEALWAAQALGLMHHAAALPLLLRALEARQPELRCSAAQALGHLGLPQAVPALLESLQGDPEPMVRQHAAAALGRLGDRQAAPLLRAHLAEGFGEVSEACREALVAMGDPPAAELLAAARELTREDWAALKQRGE